MRAEPVLITKKHTERYIELAKAGTNVMAALPIVAQEFGLSRTHKRQAVQMKLRKLGLQFKRGRKGRPRSNGDKPKVTVITQPGITLDTAIEVIVMAFEQAAKVPGLEEENNHLRNSVAAYKNANEQLKRKSDALESQDKRIRLAQQQGNIKSNFTYHIELYDPKLAYLIATTAPLLNISEGVFCFN